MSKPKVYWRDSQMTWPSVVVKVELLPWSWRLIPQVWRDWDMTPSCSFTWLFLSIEFMGNKPLFVLERETCAAKRDEETIYTGTTSFWCTQPPDHEGPHKAQWPNEFVWNEEPTREGAVR